ncbi:hypothetical protein bcere0019_9220 [Bacillus cereus Rock3-28]|nr:hypothetical protein bcere0019_9220 [Bacillus cereus Rock3-28]
MVVVVAARGEAGKSGFPFIILLFIVLIIVGVSYIGLGF